MSRPPRSEEKYTAILFPRISTSVDIESKTGCWLWKRGKYKNGYGKMKIREFGVWKTALAHRVIYKLFRGMISEDLELDHLCRVRNCVNPYHLEAVTRKVNSLRAIGVGPENPRRTHCKRGHSYTEENLVHYEGRNRCRLCIKERKRKT